MPQHVEEVVRDLRALHALDATEPLGQVEASPCRAAPIASNSRWLLAPLIEVGIVDPDVLEVPLRRASR